MPLLTAENLLDTWERGLDCQPLERALLLLETGNPDAPTEVLANLAIGERDARLIELRESVFGTLFLSLVKCPACREQVELSFTSRNIMPTILPETEPLTLTADGYELRFRLPNTVDLSAIAAMKDTANLQSVLFERCMLSAVRERVVVSLTALPAELINAVSAEMAAADPRADIQLACTCPACGHEWHAVFDIVSFFWSELHAWAVRMLGEVHKLAQGYGWSESGILAMSARRRQSYLELLET